MSETIDTEGAVSAPEIPNFSVRPGAGRNSDPTWVVTFGTRQAEFRKIKLSDTWDMQELAKGEISDRWYNMATLAVVATSIDAVPLPPQRDGITRPEIRQRLDRLGLDGLLAIAKGMEFAEAPTPSADETATAAKN